MNSLPPLEKVLALIYSPSRDKYQVVNYVNHFLDNWTDHENCVDDDWRVLAIHESHMKLKLIQLGMRVKRELTRLNKKGD